MLAVSLIGVTAGTEVCTFGRLPVSLSDDWVEVQPSEVTIGADSADLYVCTRRMVEGKVLTWIGLYRHAHEIGGSRAGAYHGAGVWLLGRTARGGAVVQVLPMLADQLRRLAMVGSQFQRRLADIRPQFEWPEREVDRVGHSMQPLVQGGGLAPGQGAGLLIDASEPMDAAQVGWHLDWLQLGPAFAPYSRVLIATDARTADSARELGRVGVVKPLQLLAAENAARESFNSRVEEAEAQRRAAEAARQTAAEQLTALQGRIDTHHSFVETLQRDLDAAHTERAKAETQLDRVLQDQARLQHTAARQAEDLSRLQLAAEDARRRERDMLAQLDAQRHAERHEERHAERRADRSQERPAAREARRVYADFETIPRERNWAARRVEAAESRPPSTSRASASSREPAGTRTSLVVAHAGSIATGAHWDNDARVQRESARGQLTEAPSRPASTGSDGEIQLEPREFAWGWVLLIAAVAFLFVAIVSIWLDARSFTVVADDRGARAPEPKARCESGMGDFVQLRIEKAAQVKELSSRIEADACPRRTTAACGTARVREIEKTMQVRGERSEDIHGTRTLDSGTLLDLYLPAGCRLPSTRSPDLYSIALPDIAAAAPSAAAVRPEPSGPVAVAAPSAAAKVAPRAPAVDKATCQAGASLTEALRGACRNAYAAEFCHRRDLSPAERNACLKKKDAAELTSDSRTAAATAPSAPKAADAPPQTATPTDPY